jgi:predicted enzyme related to lactoylglutathione lyase
MDSTHGMIWWSELMTRDVSAARTYYGSLAGWSFSTVPMGKTPITSPAATASRLRASWT